MLKANKIFIALIFALLLVAIVETFFIFVYKPAPAQIPQLVETSPTPLPKPKALTPQWLETLSKWPKYRNATLLLTENVNGTISSIVPATSTGLYTIKLAGDKRYDTLTFMFRPESLLKTKVYIQDIKTKAKTEVKIDDLKPGDNVTINFVSDLQKDTNAADLGTTITILK